MPHDVGLRDAAVGDGGDVAQVNDGALGGFERQVAEALQGLGRRVDKDVVLVETDFYCAAGLYYILRTYRGEHVAGAHTDGLQLAWIQIDHDRTLLAAVDVGHNGAGNGDELRSDLVEAVVVQCLLRQAVAGKAELQNGHGRRGEINDLRGQRAGRERTQNELGRARNLGIRGVERGALLQVNFDDDLAAIGGRLHVLDIVDERGEDLFIRGRQAALQALPG